MIHDGGHDGRTTYHAYTGGATTWRQVREGRVDDNTPSALHNVIRETIGMFIRRSAHWLFGPKKKHHDTCVKNSKKRKKQKKSHRESKERKEDINRSDYQSRLVSTSRRAQSFNVKVMDHTRCQMRRTRERNMWGCEPCPRHATATLTT